MVLPGLGFASELPQWNLRRVEWCLPEDFARCVGGDYSGLVSEDPEKAATMAGEMTIATKVRPIRRSCIGVAPLWGSSELFHSFIMRQVT
jgi:hypothetical protein